MVKLGNDWDEILADEWEKPYYKRLHAFLKSEYSVRRIYPNMYDIFNALKYTSFSDTKAVIIGQDPYHGAGQAEGLCFSVKTGMPLPPSLVNIFKEIKQDTGNVPAVIHDVNGKALYDGSLRRWASQGVLLLNATLTVREHEPGSHQRKGWEEFTDAVIRKVSEGCPHVAFMLWGGYARGKRPLIDTARHLVLESAHPSPLSATRGGWFGNRHFSTCNMWLKENGMEPIEW